MLDDVEVADVDCVCRIDSPSWMLPTCTCGRRGGSKVRREVQVVEDEVGRNVERRGPGVPSVGKAHGP